MKDIIIYTDKDIIVINKPPGISVHGGISVSGKTLTDFLAEEFPEIKKVGDDPVLRPGLVHRLDKDTTGVMVVAKNQDTFKKLKNIFKNRQAEKVYWAVVCGRVKEKKGIISFPIGRLVKNPLKRGSETGRTKIRGAREALTEYLTLQAGPEYSLLELRPKTGRMHQLRVHLKALGYPVACDRIYGGKNVCCPSGAGRQLLHAKSLSFSMPEGKKWHFEADPPEDMAAAIKMIGVA